MIRMDDGISRVQNVVIGSLNATGIEGESAESLDNAEGIT